jgi:hypothetical protein
MGAGGSVHAGGGGDASNASATKVKKSRTVAKPTRAGTITRKQKGKSDQDFKTICRVVFDEADRNGNNMLDDGEASANRSAPFHLHVPTCHCTPT